MQISSRLIQLSLALVMVCLFSVRGHASAASAVPSTACVGPLRTVTLSPTTGNTPQSDSTYFQSGGGATHLWPDLRVRSYVGGLSRAILHFNLPTDLRSTSTVCRASLRVWVMRSFGASPIPVAASQVLQPWANPVAWPGPAFGAALDTPAVAGQGWYSWNVAGAVNNWKSVPPASRYGLGLSATGAGAERQFASSEFGDATKRPVLIVTYVP